MIDHATIKLIHIGCAALTLAGFTTRGILMLAGSHWLKHPFTKRAPHFIDTLLFISGIWLAINIQQFPGSTTWLSAKLGALLCYILLGFLALRGSTKMIRIPALLGALAMFSYILAVALTRDPVPWC